MSNIIDGIDYGMGYEPTKEWFPGITGISRGGKDWCKSITKHQGELDYQINCGNMFYRRPLPIISQHPGAIPLEPGEELIEGECYLMRDGRLTGPMPCDGHEAFPFGVDGTPDTWRRDGCCWDNSLSRNDIVARLPKVEQREPEPEKEKGEGDKCRHNECSGEYGYNPVEDCLCHISPPCSACVNNPLVCLVCGDDPQEMFEPITKAEPEKAKEKKVSTERFVDLVRFRCGHKSDLSMSASIPLSEASRIAQLPEVIAEVERQRAEKEIKVGDWFWTKSGTPDRAHAIGIEKPEVLGQSDKWHKAQDCAKIHDPAFIAFLEKGSQP